MDELLVRVRRLIHPSELHASDAASRQQTPRWALTPRFACHVFSQATTFASSEIGPWFRDDVGGFSGLLGPPGADLLNPVRTVVKAAPRSWTELAPPSCPAPSTGETHHAQTEVANLRAGAGLPFPFSFFLLLLPFPTPATPTTTRAVPAVAQQPQQRSTEALAGRGGGSRLSGRITFWSAKWFDLSPTATVRR